MRVNKRYSKLKPLIGILLLVFLFQSCVSKKKFVEMENQQRELMKVLDQQRQENMQTREDLAEQRERLFMMEAQNRELIELNEAIRAELEMLTIPDTLSIWASTGIIPRLPGGYEEITLNRMFVQSRHFVDELEPILDHILAAQGYHKNRYFPIKNGFGLMTSIEQIYNDGTSKPVPERWNHNVKFSNNGNGFWGSFSKSRNGRFRMFVFIITDEMYQESEQELGFEEAKEWLMNGLNGLPASSYEKPITSRHYCDVLVYEFEKSDSCPEGCNNPSGYTAKDHLIKAKLWQSLTQQ